MKPVPIGVGIWAIAPALLVSLSACERANDPAVTIADRLQAGSKLLGREEGAHYILDYPAPGRAPSCAGVYRVQLTKVSALVVWCLDTAGNTIDSGSTTYHRNFVDVADNFLLTVPAKAGLRIDLERQGGRAVIVDVRPSTAG